MKTLSGKQKLLVIVVLPLVLILLGAGTLGYAATRDPVLPSRQRPNAADSRKAADKIKLLTESQKSGRRGFIPLSESEINSFLNKNYSVSPTNQVKTNVFLSVRSSVVLTRSNLTFITWNEKYVLGLPLKCVLQRTVELEKSGEKWYFPMTAMKVGMVPAPSRLWPWIERQFETSDQVFQDRYHWVAAFPALEITTNETSDAPEFRLYTYVPEPKPKK